MRRHDLDVLSLLTGLLYIGIGVVVLLHGVIGLQLPLRWLAPALLIALGLAGLVGSRRRGRRSSESAEQTRSKLP